MNSMSRAAPKSQCPLLTTTIFLFAAAFVLSMLLWAHAARVISPWQEQPLRVWMLDVGQGDAFFIEFPTGERWLIDGGPDDAVLAKLGSLLAPWDRTLDAILLTHPDADHVTGLVGVLDRYHVDTVYETGVRAHTPNDEAFTIRLETIMSGLPPKASSDEATGGRTLLNAGDVLWIGDVTLTIVWPDGSQEGSYPDKRNNLSINLVLEYGQTRVLFTGDAEAVVEQVVGPRAGDVDVLKVGHHGSLTSSAWTFLETIDPEAALISVGRDNSYGHPHPSVVGRLEDADVEIFRTDLHRDVVLTSYGGKPLTRSHPLPF